MPTYVALLRGINVGGHKKVPMADLRVLAADLGYQQPATYIQSGNLVFTSDEPPDKITEALSAGLAKQLGVAGVDVVVRTAAELAALVDANPFPEAADDPKTLVVWFLDRAPAPDAAKALAATAAEHAPERAELVRREIFLHLPDGQGRAALPPLLGRHLKGYVVTARNWRTVLRLRDMASATGD